MLPFIVAALLIFFLSLFFSYCYMIFACKKNILDFPNERSLHKKPIPRGGGIVFVFLFYIAVIFLWFLHFIKLPIFLSLLGGIPIACVGYCDDLFGVKSRWRAMVHTLSAIWSISFLGVTSTWFFMSAVFITVWFVNLYNFMDGIDSLAGMEAVFVGLSAGFVLLFLGFFSEAALCFVIAFSVLGFLIFNWSPAKIFMGDAGSGFLGFIFAELMWITHRQHQLPIVFWWILLSVFIADASYTLIYRIIRKKTWYLAHREHAYQLLAQAGFTHRKITLWVLCINLLFCLLLAVFSIKLHNIESLSLLLFIFLVFVIAWFWVTRTLTQRRLCDFPS